MPDSVISNNARDRDVDCTRLLLNFSMQKNNSWSFDLSKILKFKIIKCRDTWSQDKICFWSRYSFNLITASFIIWKKNHNLYLTTASKGVRKTNCLPIHVHVLCKRWKLLQTVWWHLFFTPRSPYIETHTQINGTLSAASFTSSLAHHIKTYVQHLGVIPAASVMCLGHLHRGIHILVTSYCCDHQGRNVELFEDIAEGIKITLVQKLQILPYVYLKT